MNSKNKKIHEDSFVIFYENTDSSGFAYHTTYLSFAERARSNLLICEFPDIVKMLKNNINFFVVKELRVNFIKPSFLFDSLKISTFFVKNTYTSINLAQNVYSKNIKVCEIFVRLVWIRGSVNRPSKIPSDIISRFKSLEVV